MITGSDSHDKNKDGKVNSDEKGSNSNGPRHSAETESKKTDQTKLDHHHHKRSRGKNYETSSDDKKTREKKKRKKSREHDKKKSKKDRKARPEKEKGKKSSSKAESIEKVSGSENTKNNELYQQNILQQLSSEVEEKFNTDKKAVKDESNTIPHNKNSSIVAKPFRRSDSILDINPNIDLEIDEWAQPEMSKWERDENKPAAENLDFESESNEDRAKKTSEEKVTSEIIKRAEHAIFARAISAIRPLEIKGKSKSSDASLEASKKELSPLTSASKRIESSKDSKVSAFQVTVPANESGLRSVELKITESSRDLNKLRKSPMRPSIKNRLGVKVIDKRSRTKSLSRSPKRRLQSDCKKVVRSSRDGVGRSHAERSSGSGRDRHPSSENRRSYKPLSSCVKVSHERESRDSITNHSRGRMNDRKRSFSAEDKNNTQKRRRSRSRSHSRNNTRRSDQRTKVESKSSFGGKAKENSSHIDEKPSKAVEQSLNDVEKLKVKSSRQNVEPPAKKRSRDSSSSSSSSSSSQNSQKHSKRHGKQKKKKSRSLSAESNGTSKRKKSKKEKKVKKKKKSSRK